MSNLSHDGAIVTAVQKPSVNHAAFAQTIKRPRVAIGRRILVVRERRSLGETTATVSDFRVVH
jgi:hypothetical protein